MNATGATRLHAWLTAVSVPVLLWIGRDQWFLRDDWFVVAQQGQGPLRNLFIALVDHLVLVPAIIFRTVFNLVGLHAYWPYLLMAVVAHVVFVHLLLRLALRGGAEPLLTLTLSTLVLVSPLASDDVLFAVNMAFSMAMSLALGALLVLDPDPTAASLQNSPVRWLGGATLLLLATTSTSVGLVLTGLVGLWVMIRGRVWQGLAVMAPSVLAYLAWVVTLGDTRSARVPPGSAEAVLRFVYALVTRSAATFTRLSPVMGLVALAVLVVVGWPLARSGQSARPALMWWRRLGIWLGPTGLLALSAAGLVIIAALGRSHLPALVAAPRYAYMFILLLLPTICMGATRLMRPVAEPRRTVVVLLVASALILTHTRAFEVDARAQAIEEGLLREQLSAIARLLPSPDVDASQPVDVLSYPGLTFAGLQGFVEDGDFDPFAVDPGPAAVLAASATVGLSMGPGEAAGAMAFVRVDGSPSEGLVDGCVDLVQGQQLYLDVQEDGALSLLAMDGGRHHTLWVLVEDSSTGVTASFPWVGRLDGEGALRIRLDGVRVQLRLQTAGRVEVCGLSDGS